MKTKPMSPDPAFPDPRTTPTAAELDKKIGPAAAKLIARTFAALTKAHPQLILEWKFSEEVGWHEIPMLKRRRVLYLVPKRGDFRFSVIIGGKAVDDLRAGPHGQAIARLLETAPRYPEGTVFSFDRHTLQPDLALAVIEAKLAH